MSRRTRRQLRRARPLLWLILVVSGLLLLGGALVGLQTWQAKRDLVEARSSINAAHQAVRDGDQVRAKAYLEAARAQAHRANGRITGWIWSGYGHLPLAGPVVREARGLIEVTDVVTAQVLGPLVSAAPGSAAWSGHADLATIRQTAGPLAIADARLNDVRIQLAELPSSHVRTLARARNNLSREVNALAVDVRDATVAAKVLPTLLGADRPTHLLLVAQNLSEERATGGLIGAFALLSADNGRIALQRSGSDSQLVDAATPAADLGPDFEARYGVARASSTWLSANLTPDVPSAGAILAGLSAGQLHQRVDAVVLVDPVALAHVLKATGPLAVPGLGVLSADNAASLLLKDVYRRYSAPSQQASRKEALTRALDQVVLRLQRPVGGQLARELGRAASSGHVQVFATDSEIESDLRRSHIGGALPDHGPFLSLVTQDVGGSKLDYYLHRSVTYEAAPSDVAVSLGAGPETVENGTLTVQLRNAAPAEGLPFYVTTRADTRQTHPIGQLKSWVSVYLGPRSTYSSATLDGLPVPLGSEVEGDLTVFSTYVTIDPGQTVNLVLTFQQPAAPGSSLLWRQQPRLTPDAVLVRRSGSYAAYYEAN